MGTERNGTRRRSAVDAHSIVLAVAAVSLMSGCFGDPSPEPATAPLEIVVGSSQRPEEPCLLNRGEVAAGSHELLIVTESGPSTVTIRDSAGSIVVQLEVAPGQGEGSAAVELSEGKFVIECAPRGGRVSKAKLSVVPAAPGNE